MNPVDSTPSAGRFGVPVIGLVGGVASGKSLVAQMFAHCGASVLDADKAGHEVLTWPEVKRAVRLQFGDDVFTAAGDVDRAKLGHIVFSNLDDLRRLEEITHPGIGKLLEQQAAEAAARKAPAIVLDAAVMFKAGWDRLCDTLVFVDAPRDIRFVRAQQRLWTEADFALREAAQLDVKEKCRRADHVIDNSGATEKTKAQVDELWRELTAVPR